MHVMSKDGIELAIETSGLFASIAVGRGGVLLEHVTLPDKAQHNQQLMPGIDAMFARHELAREALQAIHLSAGPGSFTGLRVGFAVGKTLAHLLGAKLYAIDTLSVIARGVPTATEADHLAVCLNAKQGRSFVRLFRRDADAWQPASEPALLDFAQFRAAVRDQAGEAHCAVVADEAHDRLWVQNHWPGQLIRLDPQLSIARAEHVFALGQIALSHGEPIDPMHATPSYVRLPEPEEKWRAIHGQT